MSEEIRNLKPEALWENFYQLTQVPRPSKHEDAIQAFMMEFGEKHGLETSKMKLETLSLKKPATPGMEEPQRRDPAGTPRYGTAEEQRYRP